MGPQIWIRNYAAESERNFIAIPGLLCLSSIICIGTLFAGSSALVLTDHVDKPDTILLTLLHQYADPFFYTFVIIGIYATIFSTANSQVHALAAVYTIDIHNNQEHFILISDQENYYSYNYRMNKFLKIPAIDLERNIENKKIGIYLNEIIPNLNLNTNKSYI